MTGEREELVFVVMLAGIMAIAGNPGLSEEVLQLIDEEIAKAWREMRKYCASVKDYAASIYADQQPRIHHVIPKGDYSNRNPVIVGYISEMHDLLESGCIDINDPMNLIVISQGTHARMHTDVYFTTIYNIMKRAEYGNKESILLCLYFARMYAASIDGFRYMP